MYKVLFLHGFFASGSCIPAITLKNALKDYAEVITPDLPIHPQQALEFIRNLCNEIHPDIIVGNSNGSFLAQITASEMHIPALLGNPHFEMTSFLKSRIGQHQYKSPRKDGRQEFTIDESLISEFADLQNSQFDKCSENHYDNVWGLFGENDTLAHYEPLFLKHYSTSFHFPGNHTPTAEEVIKWYVPLIKRMLSML